MDGITDPVFRYLVAKHSKPDFLVTEFTNVEGLSRGAVKMMQAFYYDEIEKPIIAQIYGIELESFYKSAIMLLYMGFDGIDINMGCPASKVAKRGGGAALIKTPEHAQKIIRIVQKACGDFENGISMEEAGVHERIISYVKKLYKNPVDQKAVDISVKTRIGYDQDIAEEWMKYLVEARPDSICVHGRTLKQMYTGKADWDAIARAGKVVKSAGINFLGNGDIQNMQDAEQKIKNYDLDGVMVGRACLGNPWFFSDKIPSLTERLEVCMEHAYLMENKYPDLHFASARKHFAWYMKEFPGARELRTRLIQCSSYAEIKHIVDDFLSS